MKHKAYQQTKRCQKSLCKTRDAVRERCDELTFWSARRDRYCGGLADILYIICPFILSQLGPCTAEDTIPNSYLDLDQFGRLLSVAQLSEPIKGPKTKEELTFDHLSSRRA